jgi:hypothetical protein
VKPAVRAMLILGLFCLPILARADLGGYASPVLVAATAPKCTSSPGIGSPGTVVFLAGRHFKNVRQVLFGSTPARFSAVSLGLNATVPQESSTASQIETVTVRTSAGACTYLSFKYVPYVVVPNVVGQIASQALEILAQSGLGGSDSGPANGAVTSESPAAGTHLGIGGVVKLTSGTPGYSSIVFTNNIETEDSLYIWLWDSTAGQWLLANDGDELGFGSRATPFALTTSHNYAVYAVDPELYTCDTPTPTDPDCVAWELGGPIPGNSAGPQLPITIQ